MQALHGQIYALVLFTHDHEVETFVNYLSKADKGLSIALYPEVSPISKLHAPSTLLRLSSVFPPLSSLLHLLSLSSASSLREGLERPLNTLSKRETK